MQTILELGSLEGGHTFAMAKHKEVEKILAIEGRQANIAKTNFMKQILGINNIEFLNANLESIDLAALWQFDAVYCVGLLYHLPQPWN